MSNKVIKISKEKDEIVIRVAIKDLVFVAENNPESPFRVTDNDAFANAVVNELKNYSNQNECETGLTHVEQCFDDILNQVAEGGYDFIENIELREQD